MGRTNRKRRRKVRIKEKDKNVSSSDPIIKLLQWIKTSGQWKQTCQLQLTEFAPVGLRGLMTKHDVDPLDILVRIPFKLLVTKEVAVSFIKNSNCFRNHSDLCKNLTTLELLVIFLLLNKKQETNNLSSVCYWKPYLDTLPNSYEVPYFCTDDEIKSFPSYLKIPTLEQKTKVMKSFRKITLLVKNAPNRFTFNSDDFAWSWFTVNTRAVYFKNLSTEKPSAQVYDVNLSGDHENLALAPFLDMFNHSSMASVEAGLNLRLGISKNCYEIITNNKYQKYDQVFISYGPHGNLRLYVEYGFTEENNLNDFVPITIDEIRKIILLHCDLTSENQLIEKAFKIVQRNKLHENLRIEFAGPTWNIAASFFILNSIINRKINSNSQTKLKDEWQNVFMIEDFSGHVEISSQLLMLVSSKLKELASSAKEINKKLADPDSCHLASDSYRMAHRLINLHHCILNNAVKCVAQCVH